MKVSLYPIRDEWSFLLERPVFDASKLEDIVKPVLANVKANGDKALKEYAQKFDGVSLNSLIVTEKELSEAEHLVAPELKEAIAVAEKNIKKFHEAQFSPIEKIETTKGVTCWRETRAIDAVGLYIPGGTAPLFSTVLMLVVPAQVAGCKNIVLSTPPNKEGKIHPAILYTAHKLGVKTIIKSGGAQAIAAMAYGTESVPKTYKIFGPGNQYVTSAKQLVSKDGVAIDMPAGPSEVAVWADEDANPEFIASDLLSQAEHGVDSQVIFVTTSDSLAQKVSVAVYSQLAELSRKEIAEKALLNSKTIVLKTEDEIIDLLNQYAPEHLIIQTENYKEVIPKIVNVGSVFLGAYTPESAGDYASGTNHTLPTNGYAMAYSGVSLDSFVKKITFQEITKEGIQTLGKHIEVMAAEEQLDAHKNAVTLRIKD